MTAAGRRRAISWLAASCTLLAFLTALLPAPSARAHKPGQPSFLKVDGRYVDYYPVVKARPVRLQLPQSIDVDYHLPGRDVAFVIDTNLLKVAYAGADPATFAWDFGDGASAAGAATAHRYGRPGTYIVTIHATVGGKPGQLIESTSMQIFPDDGFSLPRVNISVNGEKRFNDTGELRLAPDVPYRFEAAMNGDVGPVRYEWDFGSAAGPAEGPAVERRFGAGQAEVFPLIRAHFKLGDGDFFVDNAVWLRNPQVATASAGAEDGGLFAGLRRQLEQSAKAIFNGGTINLPLALLVLLFATVAGGLHALLPGHGKTILAALLVGRDGHKYRDLAILTASVTIAHTLVIYLIGFSFLVLNSQRSANSLLPFFETLSLLLVLALAAYLIYGGTRRLLHERSHRLGHEHSHGHGPGQHSHELPLNRRRDSWSLVLAGTGGGIVPCIDALSLMLLAVGTGHAAFGLLLVLFFSLGLAGTITAFGLLLIAGKGRLLADERRARTVATYAPLVSGVVILALALLTMP